MSEEDTDQSINEAFGLLTVEKELREKFLKSLSELQKARVALIEHEVKTISNNDTHDPRLDMLKSSVEGGKQVLKAIKNELEIGSISVPKIKDGEAIIHGRIIEENGQGLKNCEISLLVDGEPLNVMGKSDDSGYYSIILPSHVVKKVEEKNIDVYVRNKGFLIDKSIRPLKLAGNETKYEVVISKAEIKNIQAESKTRKEGRKIKN